MKWLITLLTLSCVVRAEQVEAKSDFSSLLQSKVSFESTYLSNAGFKGYASSVQTYKQKFQINNEIMGISFSQWAFDWDHPAALPFYKNKIPLDSMQRIKLYTNIPWLINEHWIMLNMLNINLTYEKEYANAFGAGIVSFFSYKLDEDHALQMGAFANYHPIKTLALPVLGYTYRARAKSGLSMVLGFPRAYIGYHLNSDLFVNAGAIYSQAIIRLADDSGIEPQGYVEAKDYQANIGFQYELNEDFTLCADILYTFKRTFTIFDHNAAELDDYSIEPSAGVILKLTYNF